ncbi:hypothetical protein [Paenibacillus apiarius]|uniref:hypothetical protein n=1 Tax=Paenibacillus apiarius TaxID=46240 RepID=UPI003B3AC750
MFLAYDVVSESIGRVRAVYHNPLAEQIEMEPHGFFAEEVPAAEEKAGLTPILMVLLDSKELYYDYVEIPESLIEGKPIGEELDETR